MGLTLALPLRGNARHCSSPRSGVDEAFAPAKRGKIVIGRLPGDIELVLVVEVINDVLVDDVLVLDGNELLDNVCLHSHERVREASKADRVVLI